MEFNYTIDEDGRVNIVDGIEEIPRNAFYNNTKIKEIILPNSVTKIGDYAFFNSTLEKITISDNVKEIGIYVFTYCTELNEVILSNSLEEIPHALFENCQNLKKIIIPNNIVRICNFSFAYCDNLEEIILPNSVTKIGEYAFYGCASLKKIIIPKSVKKISFSAFGYCNSLEKITLYANIDIKNSHSFDDSLNIKEIVVNYDTIDELDKFSNLFIDFISDYLSSSKRNKKLDIIFVGSKIPILKQLKYVTKLLKFKMINVSFKQELNSSISKNNDISISKEIKDLIDKINNISNNLSDNTRSIINNKLDTLLNNYKLDLESYQDTSNSKLDIESDVSLSLEIGKTNPEIILLTELTAIYSSLCNQEKLLNDLSKLEEYRKIINSSINDMSTKEESIEDILKTIIFIISKIDKNKKEETLNLISNYLSNIEKEYRKQLDNSFKSNILTLESNNLNTTLKEYLLDILKKIKIYYDKVIPYLDLLEVLNTNNVDKYDFGDTFEATILSVKYLISCIKNNINKKEIEDLFNEYISHYKEVIYEKIEKLDTLDKNDYKELEKNMLIDINPILENLNFIADIDVKEEIRNSKIDNIILEINDSIKVLEGDRKISISNRVIVYFISEFYELLTNSKIITKEEKKENIEKMKNYLITCKSEINITDKETNLIINDIVSSIAKRYLNLEIYLTQNKDYKKERRYK